MCQSIKIYIPIKQGIYYLNISHYYQYTKNIYVHNLRYNIPTSYY